MQHFTHMQITADGHVFWSGLISRWEECLEGDPETADRLRDGETIDIGFGAGPVFTLVPIAPNPTHRAGTVKHNNARTPINQENGHDSRRNPPQGTGAHRYAGEVVQGRVRT